MNIKVEEKISYHTEMMVFDDGTDGIPWATLRGKATGNVLERKEDKHTLKQAVT